MARTRPGQLLFAGFEGTELPDDLAERIASGRVGGVVLFSRNVQDFDQLRGLIEALHALAPAEAPLCVAIDQEGGRVQRLRTPWTEWPPMRCVGQLGSLDETRELARALARELADLRIDVDFAPVADVDSNPDNPAIGDRSFSHDPAVVAQHVSTFVGALQEAGVGACAKHFPGHGDTAQDSHLTLPSVDCDLERLRRIELVPFRAAAGSGVASMMTAHVVVTPFDSALPATLSPAALDCLRREVGFDGLVFSDDLEMAAIAERFTPREIVTDGLDAGLDAFLVCRRADLREEVLSALESVPEARLERSLARMATFKRRFSGGRHASGESPPYPAHRALAERLGKALSGGV